LIASDGWAHFRLALGPASCSGYLAETNDNLDADNLGSFRSARRRYYGEATVRNVKEFVCINHQKVVMRRGVGVEKRVRSTGRDFAQETKLREFMQRVVYRRQRDTNISADGLTIERLRRDVSISPSQNQATEGDSMSCLTELRVP